MKKILTLLVTLLLAVPAFAQVDIVSPWRGPFGDLGRGLTWGASGTGGMNNAFIINLPSPQLGGCVYVHNLDGANAHRFTPTAYTTADQRALGYYLNPVLWAPISIATSAWPNIGIPGVFEVGAGATVGFSLSPASGSRLAIVIAGSVAPGTADLFYSFGSPSPCAATIPINAKLFTDYRPGLNANLQVNWIGQTRPPWLYIAAPQDFSTCTFYLWAANTAGAAPTLNVRIQTYDSTTGGYDDKVSFVQVTVAPPVWQTATVLFDVPTNPRVVANNTLAAATLAQGRLSDSVLINYTLTGAGATYNVELSAICCSCRSGCTMAQ